MNSEKTTFNKHNKRRKKTTNENTTFETVDEFIAKGKEIEKCPDFECEETKYTKKNHDLGRKSNGC